MNRTSARFYHETRANADLYQEYASIDPASLAAYQTNGGNFVWVTPKSVVVRNTPVTSAEELNRDLGLYAQDTYTLKRLTVSAGIRWETLSASVVGLTAPAGRFVPERPTADKKDQPKWDNWAPRFQAVLDVFGNAKTAVKYSFNRYNASQTTTIASGFNPLASTTTRINWTDLNGDDIAQGSPTFDKSLVSASNPSGRVDCVYLTPGCEIDLQSLSKSFGVVSDNGTYAGFPRQYSLEQGLEVQHELLPRLSLTGSWYYGSFKNLTTTLNRNITPTSVDPATGAPDWTPVTIFNPETAEPIVIYNQSKASIARATKNETFVDDSRRQIFDSYSVDSRLRVGRGATLSGGFSWGRTRTKNCTVGENQNPNSLRFCDQFNLEDGSTVPYDKTLKLSGSYPLPWYGILVSGVFQSIDGGGLAKNYTITPSTAYPDGGSKFLAVDKPVPACPAPCPAGATVLSTLGQSSLVVALQPSEFNRGERLNQLDLKVSKTIKYRSLTIQPNFEAFNINNTDKVITYGSTSYAISAGTYLKPNSITQGRILGVGASVRW
jgi:hypothetical protein